MPTDTLPAVPATKTQSTTVLKSPDFGKGRFQHEMNRLYESSQILFGFTPEMAEKFARQAASDAGAILANASASIRISAPSVKAKTATISDASKLKGVTLTNALNVCRAIQWIDDAGRNNVSFGFTKWKLASQLDDYVKSLMD